MAGRKFLNHLDMVGNQILNALLHVIAGDASSPSDGQVWYNSSTHKFRGRNNGSNVTFVNDGGDLSAGSVANTALATNPLARANHTGTQTASTISDFDTQVRTSRLDQMAAPTADVSMNTHKITGVVDPTSAQDAATKNYVDTVVNGLNWKDSVRVASTANGTLASAFANGSTVDGVTLVTGDRILLKNQTTGTENGIYTVNASGAPTRATDADSNTEILQATVFVQEGTAGADTAWTLTNNSVTLGTTSLTFAQFGAGSSYTGGNGITITGNSIAATADPTPADIVVGSSGIKTDPTKIPHIYTTTVGDGSSTDIVVTHNLGTRAVVPRLFLTGSPYDEEDVPIDHTSTNTVTLHFATAPSSGQFTIVILG